MDTRPALHFDDVSFTYDGTTFVLDGITFSINKGSTVGILGGNGSGKSTFAKLCNALLVPDQGCVTVFGRHTEDTTATYDIRSDAGMVFQNPDDQLIASLIENDVAFGPENLGVPTNQLRERVTEALASVGLQGFERTETAALSGGQKQRVAIAGVLAMQPKILILDEASAMLDPQGRRDLLDICRDLHQQGMTIIMITHFMEETLDFDQDIVLDKGSIALSGTPQDVLTQIDRLHELNLEPPFACKLSDALQQRGVPVHLHSTDAGLITDLKKLYTDSAQDALATSANPSMSKEELQ